MMHRTVLPTKYETCAWIRTQFFLVSFQALLPSSQSEPNQYEISREPWLYQQRLLYELS
jgi:hypothetical protein